MREYKRKTERATQSQEVYELAPAEVLENNCSIWKPRKNFDVYHLSLYRYIKKKKNNESPKVGYVKSRQVFSRSRRILAEEESKMSSYILKCAEIYFGLPPIEIRKLAFSYITARPDPTEQLENVLNKSENLSLNLEHPKLLYSAPEVDISPTETLRYIEIVHKPTPSCFGQNQFSPSKIRPLPKALSLKTNTNCRRKRKSAVLTDTPEKEVLRMKYEEMMKKKQKEDDKDKGKEKRKGKEKGKKNVIQKVIG